MIISPYASQAKIDEALSVIGQTAVADTEQGILRQIVLALGNRGVVGGDPEQNAQDALGGSILATTEQGLLTQIFVLAATVP